MGELIDKLTEYGMSGRYPFHMPGHKRNVEMFNNPYSYDITEIDGFDDLHEAEDILLRLKKRLAEMYGAKEAHILVNGSTGGIHAAISAVVEKGEKILVARNSHKSVYNGVFLKELECEYIYPQTDAKRGINYAISPEIVDKCIKETPEIKAVLITSPTYEGIISDIEAIAKVVHSYNIPLIVDAAHGAHLGFGASSPDNAVKSGADIVIMSLHKTLPALTQTGVMCVSGDIVDYKKIKKYFDIYTTSSPSYLLMASVEHCIDFVTGEREKFDIYYDMLKEFYKKCKLTHLELIKTDDIGKIVVSTVNTTINGAMLAKMVREHWNIEPEMVSAEYVVFMTSVCDKSEGFERLIEALQDIDSKLEGAVKDNISQTVKVKAFCKIAEADGYEEEQILLENTEGRVSYNFIYAYPPGIPIVAPGEIIDGDVISLIKEYSKAGVKLCGITADLEVGVCVTEGK